MTVDLDELESFAPDTPAALRVASSGVPNPAWDWVTARHVAGSTADAASLVLQQWCFSRAPKVHGVLLHGGAGLGKTGLACCVVKDLAARGVGSRALWHLVTSTRTTEAVARGDFRARPAPAMFYRWRDMKSLLDRAKVDSTPWDENPPLTAEKVLEEIEDRCEALALDDVDVDVLTPWKEEVLLRLLELPNRQKRLVVTMNVSPASDAGVQRLGERVVDRLLDPSLFARFHLTGDSLRRRK